MQIASARPLKDDVYKLCGLPRDFPDDELFDFKYSPLYCCKCLKHQVAVQNCTYVSTIKA